MKTDLSPKESFQMSPEQVWRKLVQVTEGIGTDEARSVAVLLYLAIVMGQRCGFAERLRHSVKFFRRQPYSRTELPHVSQKGLPLFAFLHDTPANTNNLLPVFQAAQRRSMSLNVLTGEEVQLSHRGVNAATGSISITHLIGLTPWRERLALLQKARKHVQTLCAACAREVPQWRDLIWTHKSSLAEELALALMVAGGLRRLYEAWEPSFVVTTSNLWPMDHVVFTEARRFGIPSFVIQHGVINHYWWPFDATKMLLWGKSFEQELLKLGAPASRLEICGMPASDHLFSQFQNSRTALNDGCRRPASFLLLSHMHGRLFEPEPYAKFKPLFQALVKATPEIRWEVKLHPLEDESFFQELIDSGLPNFRILPKSLSLEEAVRQADVACTLWSTAGLEALIMRRPLVVFDVDEIVREYAWWPKCGGGCFVPTLDDALKYVKQASSDQGFLSEQLARQDRFLAENFVNPRRASDACLDAIHQTVDRLRPKQGSSHPFTGQQSRQLNPMTY